MPNVSKDKEGTVVKVGLRGVRFSLGDSVWYKDANGPAYGVIRAFEPDFVPDGKKSWRAIVEVGDLYEVREVGDSFTVSVALTGLRKVPEEGTKDVDGAENKDG